MILKIFKIFDQEDADPILLKTACELALNVFMCFTEKDNEVSLYKMTPFYNTIYNFKNLMIYIGGSSYINLLNKVK